MLRSTSDGVKSALSVKIEVHSLGKPGSPFLSSGQIVQEGLMARRRDLHEASSVDGSAGWTKYGRLVHWSPTTGMPQAMCRANMSKTRFVMAEMATVLGGLTRGLDLSVLDSGYAVQEGRVVSYQLQADSLGAVLPSNSPGVHSLWIPSIALKVPVTLKPGSQEPWTPMRVAQALIAAGCPEEAIAFYPTNHSGASRNSAPRPQVRLAL